MEDENINKNTEYKKWIENNMKDWLNKENDNLFE